MDRGLSEPDVLAEMERLAALNRSGADLICFAGAGAYDHEVPSATRRLAFRSEFVTAYTPYQPEVAQGVLQALFEYQTLIARLAGLPVANASLYDGASAAVEAVNLAAAATGRQTVLDQWRRSPPLAPGAHRPSPGHRPPARRRAPPPGCHRLVGRAAATLRPPCSSPRPELPRRPRGHRAGPDAADAHGALLLVGFDPVAAGLLRPPGRTAPTWSSARASPSARHCPSVAPISGCSPAAEHVRRLPGRLVGQTVDTEGRPAYVTTLRAREQDIRREKASSNVCTNQTLIAVAAMIQLSWLGTQGLRELALRCARGTRYAREAALGHPGRRAAGRRARPSASSPSSCPCRADMVIAAWPTRVPGRGARRDRGRRRHRRRRGPAGRGDRAAHPGRDRRLRGRVGKGGALMAPPPATAGPGRAGHQRPLSGTRHEPTIFDFSVPGPAGGLVPDHRRARVDGRGAGAGRELRDRAARRWPRCPSVTWSPTSPGSAHRQYSVDLGAYPLGSCTMKYNPKLCDEAAALPGPGRRPPGRAGAARPGLAGAAVVALTTPCAASPAWHAATLQPPAGAAGELTGLLIMRAWHEAQGRSPTKVIIPDSAHGTNPASVTPRRLPDGDVPSDQPGLVDLGALREHLDDDVAGIMLTNPNTLGLFEEDIAEIAAAVHEVGGLLYYDGANLNAILGVTRPGRHGL